MSHGCVYILKWSYVAKMRRGCWFRVKSLFRWGCCLSQQLGKPNKNRTLTVSPPFYSMAAAISLSFSLDPQSQNHYFKIKPDQKQLPFPKYRLLIPHKYNRYAIKSSSSSPPSTTTTTTTSSSFYEDPFRTGSFLSNEELEKLKLLEDFWYYQELESGSLSIRVMRAAEMDITVALLAESFAESMVWPSGYLSLLRFLVKQYLIERRALMPHAATLIGFYKEKQNGILEPEQEEEEEEEELAGTVEVCFDKRGANASPPTPISPKNSPYICNMTVKNTLRRCVFGFWIITIWAFLYQFVVFYVCFCEFCV